MTRVCYFIIFLVLLFGCSHQPLETRPDRFPYNILSPGMTTHVYFTSEQLKNLEALKACLLRGGLTERAMDTRSIRGQISFQLIDRDPGWKNLSIDLETSLKSYEDLFYMCGKQYLEQLAKNSKNENIQVTLNFPFRTELGPEEKNKQKMTFLRGDGH